MRNLKALILAPFDHSYQRVRDVIQENLRRKSMEIIRDETLFSKGAVSANAVSEAILEADLIVADISRKNPNVFYELGIAHTLRKTTLLLIDTNELGSVPFDLAVYQMIIYDPKNLTSLENQMSRFLDYQQSKWQKL